MKKILGIATIALLGTGGVCGAEGEAVTKLVRQPEIDECAPAIDFDNADAAELTQWAEERGGTFSTAGDTLSSTPTAGGRPTCPIPRSCPGLGGPCAGIPCQNVACTTTDLGFSACVVGFSIFSCPKIGQTVHQRSCRCENRLGTPQCPPGQVCGSSLSLFCQ